MIPVATLIPHAWRQGNPRLRSPLHRPTEKSAVFKGSESTEPIDWRYLPFFLRPNYIRPKGISPENIV